MFKKISIPPLSTPTPARRRVNLSLKATHKIIVSLAAAALLVALGVAVSFWAFRQIEVAGEAAKA